MWKFVRGDSRCTWPWPPKERESGQVILFGTLNNSDFEKMKGESEMFLKKYLYVAQNFELDSTLYPETQNSSTVFGRKYSVTKEFVSTLHLFRVFTVND